jgi:CxxC motif-containing protein (DUF1111 family)
MRRLFAFALLLLPASLVLAQDGLDRVAGKALFERIWVPAPSSTDGANGLGPLFSERSCLQCHNGPGGGASIAFNEDRSIVTRGVTAHFGDAAGKPDPVYGTDLQTRAVQGVRPEGGIEITSKSRGEPLTVGVTFDRGAPAAETRISVRLAPPLIGRARLDLVDEGSVIASADPDDHDRDGVSGRASLIETADGKRLGRFGWKAEQVDLVHQIAHAFAADMGLSSTLQPRPYGDCTIAEVDCFAQPNGRSAAFDGEEISRQIVELVAGYVRGLEPPSSFPPAAGEQVFTATGCAACHTPALPSREGGIVTVYSDLLLHDMGPALDDGVGAPGAASPEWRTTPLAALHWSLGTTRRYLHDGRAPTLDAAIRAHGGEASGAARKFEALPADDRAALIAFLEQL